MRKSTRQAKTAAKARLSGAIPTNSSDVQNNKKIVFDDDDDDASNADEAQITGEENDNLEVDDGEEGNEDEDEVNDADESDDDNVEEVTGSAARESTQQLRDAERKMAKEAATPKKKRKKLVEVAKEENKDQSEIDDDDDDDEEEVDDMLTDAFLKMVDSERADQLQQAKQDKKKRKLEEKKRLGKHTTFVVEDEYNMIDAPQKMSQNIEVVALGVGTETDDVVDEQSRQHLISATLGTAPSKAAIAFARGSLSSGISKERGAGGRKRTGKKEETWKRSRKMNSLVARSRPGSAAAFFVRKR